MIFFQMKRRAKHMQLFYAKDNKHRGFRQDGNYYNKSYLGEAEIAFDDRRIIINDPIWIAFKMHNENQKNSIKDII